MIKIRINLKVKDAYLKADGHRIIHEDALNKQTPGVLLLAQLAAQAKLRLESRWKLSSPYVKPANQPPAGTTEAIDPLSRTNS